MLSKNQVVKVRKAIEKTYIDKCTIIEHQPYTKENKSEGYREVPVLEGQPCKISFSSSPATNQTEAAAQVVQITKVIMAPEIKIEPNSKLIITQRNGTTNEYQHSGKPASYDTHQEITLELFKGWA